MTTTETNRYTSGPCMICGQQLDRGWKDQGRPSSAESGDVCHQNNKTLERAHSASRPYRSTPEGDALRQQSAAAYKRSTDSFERCDTDGALSQWAADSSARRYDAEADLVDGGGRWTFLALFDLDGNLVPAKIIATQYGSCFAVLSDADVFSDFTGEFVSIAKRQATYVKKGYRLGVVEMAAKVETFHAFVGSAGQIIHKPVGSFDDARVISNGENIKHEDDAFEIMDAHR